MKQKRESGHVTCVVLTWREVANSRNHDDMYVIQGDPVTIRESLQNTNHDAFIWLHSLMFYDPYLWSFNGQFHPDDDSDFWLQVSNDQLVLTAWKARFRGSGVVI